MVRIKGNYTDSEKNIPKDVRIQPKREEIANALLEERNMEEGVAIAIAINSIKRVTAYCNIS